MIHTIFIKTLALSPISELSPPPKVQPGLEQSESFSEWVDYLSDHSIEADYSTSDPEHFITTGPELTPDVPPHKKQKLDIPLHEQRAEKGVASDSPTGRG